MLTFYQKLDNDKKIFFWLSLIGLVVYLALMPLYFFGVDRGYQWPNGWLLGSLVELISYLTLLLMTNSLAKKAGEKNVIVVILNSLLRPFLYVVVLAIAAICSFRSEWFGGFDMFGFWAVFASLMPMPIALVIVHFVRKNPRKPTDGDQIL